MKGRVRGCVWILLRRHHDGAYRKTECEERGKRFGQFPGSCSRAPKNMMFKLNNVGRLGVE